MGALFSTQDNWMMHQTQKFAKGTGNFLRRTGERLVRSEVRQSVGRGAIGRGLDSMGKSIREGAKKTANFASEVTQKGREMFRKKNNNSYRQLPNAKNQNKNTNPILPPPNANKNAAANKNANKNAAANKAAANKAVENKASISPASSDLIQPTVLNTTNLVVESNRVKKSNFSSITNSGSTVQNTSSTNSANQIAKIIQNVDNLLKITISNNNPQKFLDLIKLLLLLQKITKDESLRNILKNVIGKCGGKCGDLAERKTKTQGKKTIAYYAVSEDGLKKALEKLNSEYKNKSNSQLKIDINEMLKKIYKEYSKSTPENEIPQINSPNNNARSNANTVVSNNNQNNLTENLQPTITSGGSRKKSKKSRS